MKNETPAAELLWVIRSINLSIVTLVSVGVESYLIIIGNRAFRLELCNYIINIVAVVAKLISVTSSRPG
jgi:hypothetical protein